MRSNVVVLFLATLFVNDAVAREDLGLTVTSSVGDSVKKDQVYALEFHCTKHGNLPVESYGPIGAIFGSSHETYTHFTIISAAQSINTVDPATALASALALNFSYSYDAAKGDTIDNRDGCIPDRLLIGPSALYLTAVSSFTTDFTPGKISKAFSDVASVVTSLAPVVTGVPIGKQAAADLASGQAAIDPIADLTSIFNPSEAINKQVQPALNTGTSTVHTNYSDITITVRPLDSAAREPNPVYRQTLEAKAISVAAAAPALDLTKESSIFSFCQSVEQSLLLVGFHSQDDQIVGAIHAALQKGANTQREIYACLGSDQADVAVNESSVIWRDVMSAAILTPAYNDSRRIQPPSPPQPPSGYVVARLDRLAKAIGGYNKNASPSAIQLANVQQYLANDVTIQDSDDVMNSVVVSQPGATGLLKFLSDAGYYHAGFVAALPPDVSTEYNGAVGGLLVIHCPLAVATASIDSTVLLMPIYKNGVIASFEVTNDEDEIKTFLGNRRKSLGFTLTDTASTTDSSPHTAGQPVPLMPHS